MNVGIIGCGEIAKKHINSLMKIEGITIRTVYDVDTSKAITLSKLSGAEVCISFSTCIQKSDIVYILTPPAFHKDIAIAAIQEGKHVFIEKPVSISLTDAEEIVLTAKKYNVKTMVGFNMRYREAFKKLKNSYDSGELGEIINVWSHRLGNLGKGPNWRTTPGTLCGMTIESLSHDIDIIRWIFGDPVNVRAHVGSSNKDLEEYDDNANIIFRLKDGGTAVINASWSSFIGYNTRGIIGTKGTAMISGNNYWDFNQFKYKTNTMDREFIENLDDKLDDTSYFHENNYFIECIRENREPETNVEYGLSVLQISHAILRSNKENSEVLI